MSNKVFDQCHDVTILFERQQETLARSHWVQQISTELVLQLHSGAVCCNRQQETCAIQHLVLVHGEGHIRWLIHGSTDHMVLKLVPVKVSLQEVASSQPV